ncbi:GerAB/ArcD/ProY family transporter [Bacillus cereus]
MQYADFQNLFPIAQHSFLEIMKGMKGNMFSFFGFEMLLLYYPFIKKAKNVSKICALCKFSNDYCLHIPYDFNSCIF